MDKFKIQHLVKALLIWFEANARDLPWRNTRDPYAIWVSEIMLQQTQVITVIPYWNHWLKTLPDIQSLADADTATIHKLWEGLGYYTRVRNMQKAAQQIVAQHGGEFPRRHADILELPGIGPYTAGAISSIAFNEPQPILDGNVIRVLTRLLAIAENPREKTTNQKLWQLAAQLVNAAANLELETLNFKLTTPPCSALNQSLMELGALICTPKNPQCPHCPLRPHCRAHKLGCPEKFPNLGPRQAATQQHHLALVIQHRQRYLVRQRPAGQVNAHLWEFPNLPVTTSPLDPARLIPIARENFQLHIKNPVPLRTIKHTITRYRITLQTFHAHVVQPSGCPPPSARPIGTQASPKSKTHWLTLPQLHALPFTSAHRKILHQLKPH